MKELDFLILESVISYPETLSLFAEYTECPKSDLAVSVYELFSKGYLEIEIYDRKGVNPSSVFSFEDVYKSLNYNFTLWYYLTPSGGKYFEEEAAFNWNSFYRIRQYSSIPSEWYNQIFIDNNIDKESMRFIHSSNQSTLQAWLAEVNLCSSNKIVLKSLNWHIVKGQKILYWKEASNIYVLSFSSDKSFEEDIQEEVFLEAERAIYKEKGNWYTLPAFCPQQPSEILSEYFEYYYSSILNTSKWEVEYIILKQGITHIEAYQAPCDFHGYTYDQVTETEIVRSFSYLFEHNFIEAVIFDWPIPKTCNKEVVANKVFLNQIGVQSVLDFQLIAKYFITEKGYKYCQFLEEMYKNVPKTHPA
jgi:hypothetical protein